MSRYGRAVPIFGGKYHWYPATNHVYEKGKTEWISDNCHSADEARSAIRAWWDYCSSKKEAHQ